MPKRNAWLFLAVITIIGAALRFQAISTTVIDAPLRADARIYYFAALNIERWGVFSQASPGNLAPKPDAFVPPGLPFAISPLVESPPTDRMLFRINTLQAILGSLTILLTFGFFRQFTTPAVALSAAMLTAISPHLVSLTTYLLTETLFTFLLMGGMFFLAYGWRKQNPLLAITAGILLGMSALTRSTTEYLPLILLFLLYWAADRRPFIRIIVPAAVTGLAVIAAWKLRNLMAIGALSDPTLMISTLQHGMYPNFMFNDIPESRGMPYRFDPFTKDASSVGAVLSELGHRLSETPLRYAYWYLIGKPVALLSWGLVVGMGEIFVYPVTASPYFHVPFFQGTWIVAKVLHAPLTIAAIAGSVVTIVKPNLLGLDRETRLPALLVAILITYFLAVHMVGAPFPRYGIPLRPIVYGYGLFSIVMLLKNLMQRRGWA